MGRNLSFRKWLLEVGDGDTPTLNMPTGFLKPGGDCDEQPGAFNCISLGGKDEENPNLPPKMNKKMKKQKK